MVKQVVACADDLDLQILSNDTVDPSSDFLKPRAGERLKVFAADLGELQPLNPSSNSRSSP